MRISNIIKKKRDGLELTRDELEYFIKEYTNNNLADYQASALLMAMYINKLTIEETIDLTKAMANSGDYLDLSKIKDKKIDKHSTGGVGDTTTLIMGPIVAACGVPFVKMSGRGLGHTGGTIDKLESIPGIQLDLSVDDFQKNINDINIAIAKQTGNLAPADGKLYALRDVTATVDSLSLIASSIMSKKLSLDSDGIVLDIKVGSGAFMKSLSEAEKLAKLMVEIGNAANKKTVALITNMNQPLGFAIGNNLEVIEAVEILNNAGPKDLRDLSIALSVETLVLSGKYDLESAKKEVVKVLENGAALNKFKEMIEHQKGDSSYIADIKKFKKPSTIRAIKSKKSGFIASIDTELLGEAALILGAGRRTLDSNIDLSAGIVLKKKLGDFVEAGETLLTIYTNKDIEIIEAVNLINDGISISMTPPEEENLILRRIE